MHLRDGDPNESSDPTVTAAEQGRRDRVTQWAKRLRGDKPERFVPTAEPEVAPTPEGERPYAHHEVQSTDEAAFDMGMIFRPLTGEQTADEQTADEQTAGKQTAGKQTADDADGPTAAP